MIIFEYLKATSMRFVFILFVFIASSITAQNIVPFQIYNAKGRKVSTNKFLKNIAKGEVILFGEQHDNPIAHWLELKTIQYLNSKTEISIGLEMFETHQQEFLQQYLSGKITQTELDTLTLLWSNYHTDYKPIIDFAKTNNIEVIATNIPRKYAQKVYHEGLESLENSMKENEKSLIAPLPIAYNPDLPGYKAMMHMSGHTANENFPKAQAIKDATMAYFINAHFLKHSHLFIHINGAYHSNNYEGIYWYLKEINPNLKIQTISTVSQDNMRHLDKKHKNTADYIIVVDQEMTKTY